MKLFISIMLLCIYVPCRGMDRYFIGDVPMVIQINSEWCGNTCDVWSNITKDVLEDFDCEFVSLDMRDADAQKYLGYFEKRDEKGIAQMPLPATLYKEGSIIHLYHYKKSKRYFRRWMHDITDGYDDLVRRIDGIDFFTNKDLIPEHDCVLQFVGKHAAVPSVLQKIARKVLSCYVYYVYADGKGSGIVPDNVTYTRGLLVNDDMRFDDTLRNLLHRLAPPVIPYWATETNVMKDLMSAFASREVHVVYDDELPAGWTTFANMFPFTAFVHFRSNETDRLSPSVWVYNRTVDFMYPSIGADVQSWYYDVLDGIAEPYHRLSQAPSEPHESLFDATGDTIWDWVRENDEVFLYLYGNESSCDAFEPVPEGAVAGRMDLTVNDHESFPEWVTKDMVLRYKSGRVSNVTRCNTFAWKNFIVAEPDMMSDEL